VELLAEAREAAAVRGTGLPRSNRKPLKEMISRRDLLKLSTLVGLGPSFSALPQVLTAPDHRIDIAPITLDLSPRHRLKTTAYNGQVPGALLRLKENQTVTIEVANHTDRPEVVHWHGLFTSPDADGAVEEGTPPIAPGSRARYTLTPQPSGFRWYHTHTMAMNDFARAQYSGQHGFLLIEPRENPARYDREFFLALHDWAGYLLANEDGAMNPSYAVATINGKAMGSGEPLRVRQGQRVLLHILNSSPTEVHWIAFPGHSLRVVALDGNPVPTPRTVPMLRLAPAERVSAIVEMNNPGVWMLGEVRGHVRALGMAVAVEYEDQTGPPRWEQPSELIWNYERFAAAAAAGPPSAPPIPVPLVFESRFRGHGAMESWTINGDSYPNAKVAPLIRGGRYRLQFINRSMDDHPVHLHRHSFELRSLGVPLTAARSAAADDIRGILKDVVLVESQTRTEVEFTADNPGASLFHCHQQNHMDLGFMMLFDYA
jgi:FtsP/CotA-like multicopper oxidase with cupredoxin domain